MPKVSRDTTSERVELEGLEVDFDHLDGGYSVCFETHTADADLAELFRGLPDDRAQFPRWGYVIEGKVGFRFADHEETYEAGDAYYVPPGHTPVHYGGSEIVEFSPTELLGETMPVVLQNVEAAGATR
jgi:mannose-6-phosphate isomerase-like protein (cupin superfamily)